MVQPHRCLLTGKCRQLLALKLAMLFCRGYLAAMQAYDSDAALLMQLVPLALTSALNNITTALIQVCFQSCL